MWRPAKLVQRSELDWSEAFLDSAFAPAKNGEGATWMLVIDGNDLPLGFNLASTNTPEVKLAKQTLERSRVLAHRVAPASA